MSLNVVSHIRKKASHMAFGSALYNWSLGGDIPQELDFVPAEIWEGSAENGRLLCQDSFVYRGSQLSYDEHVWLPEGASKGWLAHIHGFTWLNDLQAMGGDHARKQGRKMMESWLNQFSSWHPRVWQNSITGQRIAAWLTHYNFFVSSADNAFQEKFFYALIRQCRHLARAMPGTETGLDALFSIKGLVYAGCCLQDNLQWVEQAIDLLEEETQKQILSDGGHVSRNPETLLEAMKIYIDVKQALQSTPIAMPLEMMPAIDRMAQALRFFTYTDKKLPVFNGAYERTDKHISAVMTASATRGRILKSLPHTGYERVSMGRSLLLMDTGMPPGYDYDLTAHVAPLAMEFSHGKDRIFVSCGHNDLDDTWNMMLRSTAAHCTLTLDNRNACEISPEGHINRRPQKVTVAREDSKDAVLLDATHDGYVPLNGVMHKRRLYLGNRGQDLRGEETMIASTGLTKPVEVAIRFHLHPRALVSLVRNGDEALLRLPSGAGWRFFQQGGEMQLENSIYCGESNRPRKTKQLVIYAQMKNDSACYKWALQREG